MYISKVVINNIKCFKDNFFIDFENDGKLVLWTVILGDNAVGKSTLLECIAMGLCDEASSAALMKESMTDFLREDELGGSIEITLKKVRRGKEFKIKTKIIRDSLDGPIKIKQSISPKEGFSWTDIFVCGYGVYRLDSSSPIFDKYTQLEALYSLFADSTLMDPETILLRLPSYLKRVLVK
ncbi:MAG: AAA family ATPase, partial [candidate division Zixibacteria bacterium]|nr:AAA family ATPase [candidate division Zixibacteria bacterium]